MTEKLTRLQTLWLDRNLKRDPTEDEKNSLKYAWVTPNGKQVQLPTSDLAQYKYLCRQSAEVVWVSHYLSKYATNFSVAPMLGGYLLYKVPTKREPPETSDIDDPQLPDIDENVITYAGHASSRLLVSNVLYPTLLKRNRNYSLPTRPATAPNFESESIMTALKRQDVQTINWGRKRRTKTAVPSS
jgi:hypothetical protein